MPVFYHSRKKFSTSDDVLKLLPKCETETKLVAAATRGCLVEVKEILSDVPIFDKAEVINESKIWVEDIKTEKVWFSSNPLTAAAKEGHKDIVMFLLIEGADPTLECCPMTGVTETALSASKHSLKQLEIIFGNIVKENHYIYDQDAWKDTDDVISKHLEKYKSLICCIEMLEVANKNWEKTAYSGAIFSKQRAVAYKVGSINPNKPRNKQEMCLTIQKIVNRNDVSLDASFIRLSKHYNKLLLDKRCEMLEFRIKQNKIVSKTSKPNVITVFGHQVKDNLPGSNSRRQSADPVIKIPKRYIGA